MKLLPVGVVDEEQATLEDEFNDHDAIIFDKYDCNVGFGSADLHGIEKLI